MSRTLIAALAVVAALLLMPRTTAPPPSRAELRLVALSGATVPIPVFEPGQQSALACLAERWIARQDLSSCPVVCAMPSCGPLEPHQQAR